MDADMRGDMVSLDCRRPALVPLARQVQVVGALSAHMALTDVLLQGLVSPNIRSVSGRHLT